MPFNSVNEAINEAERLLALSKQERESEGCSANDTQLNFLIKKLNGAKSKPVPGLSGITKYVADFSSMDSKLLELVSFIEEG